MARGRFSSSTALHPTRPLPPTSQAIRSILASICAASFALVAVFTSRASAAADEVARFGDEPRGADEVTIAARGDTVVVGHANALLNCCKELTVDVMELGPTILLFEGDIGEPCRCLCCFAFSYRAGGFAGGRHTILVFDKGRERIGQGMVDLPGAAGPPRILAIEERMCYGPEPTQQRSWGGLKALYRLQP